MASIFYNEGAAHILSTYFENNGIPFTDIYVGLGTGGLNFDPDATLADLTEVDGDGYARQAITRDATPTGWTFQGATIVTPKLTYTNVGISDWWAPVDYAFFTLSANGSDDPDILIAAVELADSVLIGPQNSRSFILKLSI